MSQPGSEGAPDAPARTATELQATMDSSDVFLAGLAAQWLELAKRERQVEVKRRQLEEKWRQQEARDRERAQEREKRLERLELL